MSRFGDQEMDIAMGRVLQTGVAAAAVLMLAGGVLFLLRHGGETPDYHAFRGADANLRTLTGVLSAIVQGHGQALIQLGVLTMIATPVMRVVFAVYAFAREHDSLYVAISGTVLALLMFGLFSGW